MDLQQAPQIDETQNEVIKFPVVNTEYKSTKYYFQKKIDETLVTADAVCVSDSVKSEQNHRTIEDIKSKLNNLSSSEHRDRESQLVGLQVYQGVDLVTEFEWDSKSQNNMVVSIFQRHLSARVSPEVSVVE